MKLLLASGSATRREMLEAAGVPFESLSPVLDEARLKAELVGSGADAAAVARGLADAKALSLKGGANRLVLGSDQVLETGEGKLLSKAGSRAEAARQLESLRDTPHRLHSAAALALEDRIVWQAAETVTLHMRRFSDDFLDAYLDREWESVRYNVGCYRIEGTGVQLFERIEGSHFAILGMPLLPLLEELRRRQVVTS